MLCGPERFRCGVCITVFPAAHCQPGAGSRRMPRMSVTAINVFEQPLNERMRSFLRLEHLFQRIDYQTSAEDEWSHRGAMEALIEVLSLLGRADIKTEFIKELERHAQTLDALNTDPRVDSTRLTQVVETVRNLLTGLRAQEVGFGHELRTHELVNAARQRHSIPAGMCNFDLPTLQHWLAQSPPARQQDLINWSASLATVRECVDLCLGLVRESANASVEQAHGGFFQRQLDGSLPCQLVQVRLPASERCYAEVSAGKHRVTIRFMEQQDAAVRPVQSDRDVQFELLCCML